MPDAPSLPTDVAPDSQGADEAKVTISVKSPASNATAKAMTAPPPANAAPPRTEEEEMLLAGTQGANCSLLLDALLAGANPNVRDPKGRTPLHFMAGVGLAPAACLMIHFGADLEARDEQDLTPLHMAAGYANAQTLRVLIAAGADTEALTAQGSAFDVVKRLGQYQYSEVWMKRSAMDKRNPLKKKDEKLEKLKECALMLADPEVVRAETDWDEMLLEVLSLVKSKTDDAEEQL